MTYDPVTGRKPAMRALTPAEVSACRSCADGCWFGCETPIDESIDPMWCVVYDSPEDGAE